MPKGSAGIGPDRDNAFASGPPADRWRADQRVKAHSSLNMGARQDVERPRLSLTVAPPFGTTSGSRSKRAMDNPEQPRPAIKRDRRSTLTKEDVAQIKAHLQEGKSPAMLAIHFQVNRRTISRIHDKQTWRAVAPAAKATPLSELHKRRE